MGTIARTRRYLYALLALNLAILALIIAFFWYHQQVQDRIFDRIVGYHGAVTRAAQASLAELHYISDELRRHASLRDNPDSPASPVPSAPETIRSHLAALTEQRRVISSIQNELPDPAFETATNAALQAFDPVLRIGTEEDPTRRNLSARLGLIDELGARLRSLLALHKAEQDRLTLSGPHSGLNHPEYLMLAIGFLTVFGLAAGFGVIRSVTAASMEREAAFSALVKSEKELAHLADGLEAAQRIAHVGNWDWDRETGAEWWSDENYRIIGLEPGAAPATNETFYRTIHEDDRRKVAGIQEEAERNACPYQIDFRVALADGEIRYVREIGEPVFDEAGYFTGQRGTIQDISEQYLAENRLAEAVRRLETAQRIAKVADWEWNPESGLLTWPAQMWEVLGLPPEDEPISNDRFVAMLHPDDREPLFKLMRQAVDAKESYTVEYRYLASSGDARIIMEHGEPFVERNTGKVWLRGTVQDITEQKTAERKLANAVAELNQAQRLARVGSWTWDIVNNKDSWSDECYRIHGLQPGAIEPTGSDYLSYVHPDDRERVERAHDRAIASGEPMDIEFRMTSADGIDRIVRTHGEVAFDENGRPLRMTGTVQDISELRRREQELREIQEKFSLAFQLSPGMTAISEVETGVHIDVNDKWVEIMGRSREEAIGRTSAEMGVWANPEDRARAVELFRKDGGFRDFEAQYRTGGGQLRDFLVSARPFPVGGTPHMLMVAYDITERKAIETELRKTAEKLEKSQRAGKVGSWVWELADGKEWWSDETYRIAGIDVGSVVFGEYDFLEYIHPDDRERTREAYDRAIRERVPYNAEYRFIQPNGSEIVLSENGEMEYDADGNPIRMQGIVQDITERKAMEQQLRETADRLEKSQQIGKIGSWVWEFGTDREWWSDEVYRMFGLEVGEIVPGGFDFLDYVHPDDRERTRMGLEQAIRDGSPFAAEYRICRPDGSEIVLFEQSEVEFDADGTPLRLRGTAQDITDRKQAELAIRDAKERLEEAQHLGQMGSWTWDPAEDVEWWSDEHYRIFGLDPGSVTLDGFGFLKYVHPDDLDRVEKIERHAADTHTPFSVEYRIVRPDGTERTVFEQGEWIEDDISGKPQWRGILQDVTERKQIEQNLWDAKERLEEAQQLGRMGSWVWDQKENTELWSDEQYRMFGLDPGSIALGGWDFLEYVHPEDRDELEEKMRTAIEAGKRFSIEYRIVRTDGAERVVTEQAEPVNDHPSGKQFWKGVTQDITERKRIEQELARLNAELEQRVEDRTAELRAAQEELVKRERLAILGQLTATVSHELRNPLGAIRTSLFVIEAKTANEDDGLSNAIGRINRSIVRCDNIIDELLDFTRMRDLQIEPMDIDHWLKSVLDEQPLPPGVSLRTDFNTGDLRVPADPDRLRRAVINIYENACHALETNGQEAGSAGLLTVSTRPVDGHVEIIFEDTGPGISKETLERIFEPLYSTKNFGVGLGLPVVQQIMQQHGGAVEAHSGDGKGAKFLLRLPLARDTAQIAVPATPISKMH